MERCELCTLGEDVARRKMYKLNSCINTGCPKRYETLLNSRIKVQPLSFAFLNVLKYKKNMCKFYFKAFLALSSVNVMFPVTSNMVSPNKPNSTNFHNEIGLNLILYANCFNYNEIVQYLRHKTKQ